MKTRNVMALTLSAVMVAGLAAVPAAASSSGASAEPTMSFKTDTLKVNIWDNNQLAGLQKIADEWSEKSGVKVQIDVVDWDNYWTLLESGASGGTLPDVFWMHSNTAQMYMENDMLLNLDDYIKNDSSMDMSKYYDGIVKLYQSSGHQYAIPKDHDTIALLYNKAVFDKYGVDYPTDDWSWDNVIDAAKKITEAGKDDGVYGYAMDTSNNQDGWYNIVYDYGAQIITDDHKGTTIGSDEGKAAMEEVRKLLEVSAPQTTVSETGTDQLFKSGLTAMITQGSWMINSYYTADNAKDYAWAEIPYGDANGNGKCDDGERQSCYNGLGWAASANTSDPDAAYSLISWFCGKQGQLEQAQEGVTMAGMDDAEINEAFTKAFDGMDISAFTKVEENGTLYFRPYTRNTAVWEDSIQKDAFLAAWQDPSNADTMASACDQAQTIIENAIAQE